MSTSSIQKARDNGSFATNLANGEHGSKASLGRDDVDAAVAAKGGVKEVAVWMEDDRQRCAKVRGEDRGGA